MRRLALLLALLFCGQAQAQMNCGPIQVGSVDRSVYIKFIDDTDGTPEEGVTSATGGLNIWYQHGEHEAIVNLTEADLSALTDAHTDDSILHLDDGIYRLDLPNDCCDSGAEQMVYGGVATGMMGIGSVCALVAYDPYDPGLGLNLDQPVHFSVLHVISKNGVTEWGTEWYTDGFIETAATSTTIYAYEVDANGGDFEGTDLSRTAMTESGSTDQFFATTSSDLTSGKLYGVEVRAVIGGTTRTDNHFVAQVGETTIVSLLTGSAAAGAIGPFGPIGPRGPFRSP